MKTIETKIAKNGVKMYYLDGKRISRDKAIEISKNTDNEMLTNALGANIEFKDAQAILVISTVDPIEGGKDREFGWCFTNVVDAVEAAKKVAAPLGDRFIKAYIMGDAEHFDNKIVATVDKAGNVEIKKQIPTYIFTTYQTVTGVNCNGRTERTDTFATYCHELGDDDNFTGLYREVTFYEDWHYDGWDIKTADGTIIAKGNTEAELKKAYEAIKAGNVEVSEEIAEINAADVKVNVADDGKVIEQINVDVDTAIKIINRLNYRNDTFVYSNTTRYDNADIKCRHFDAYKDNGEKDAFAITEYVINGKLEIVRFFNLFRDIIVDLQIGNVNYTIGDKGAIVLTVDKTVTFYPTDTPKPCSGKLFGYDYCEYHSVDEYISELEFMQSAIIMERLFKNANGTYSYDGWGRKTYYMTDCYREAYYVACDTENVCLDSEDTANLIYIEQQLKNIVNGSDGSEEDIDEDNAFDYLPALDELNDVDIDDDDNTPPANKPAEEIADNEQAKKEMAHKITAYLNDRNEKRLQAGFKPIIPYASSDAHYHKLHGAAKWTVAYDSVNDTFGIWSEYGWHESGFSLGHEFCGWYKITGLAVIISRLTNAIDYAQSEFYFETDPALIKRTRRSYGKWQAVRAAHLKDKIDRDAQASEEIAAG